MPRRQRRSNYDPSLGEVRRNEELNGWVSALISMVLGPEFSGSAQWGNRGSRAIHIALYRNGLNFSPDKSFRLGDLIDALCEQEPSVSSIYVYDANAQENERWVLVYPPAPTRTAQTPEPRKTEGRPWYLEREGED